MLFAHHEQSLALLPLIASAVTALTIWLTDKLHKDNTNKTTNQKDETP